MNKNDAQSKRAELLKRMMAKRGISVGNKTQQIPKRPENEAPKPSHAQRRLWVMERLGGTKGAYNVAETMQLKGDLDIPLLTRCINAIITRHEGLRCTFTDGAEEPGMELVEGVELEIVRANAEGLDEEQIQALIDQHSVAPFDLDKGPLLRAVLFRRSETDHLLLIAIHHIISDAWSLGVVVDELAKLYAAFGEGKESPLPELPIQYGDYAAWQASRLNGESMDKLNSFWTNYLHGVPELLEMPLDMPRPPVQSHRGASLQFQIQNDTYRAVQVFSQKHACTLFASLQAVFCALLNRYTGAEDLVLGTPVAGRTKPELEPLVGFFVNTLVLRQRVEQDMSFSDLVARVKTNTLDAFDHQEMPFDRVVQILKPRRNPAYHPVFQVMFIVQNAPVSQLRLPGLELNLVPKKVRTSKFDLLVEFHEQGDTLTGQIDYNSDLFLPQTIRQLAEHFQFLLQAFLQSPQEPVSQVALLTEGDKRRLQEIWTEKPLVHSNILDPIRHGLKTYGDRVAYRFEDLTLTYGDVDRLSNGIASFLQAKGVGKGHLIPVLMKRNWRVPTALLGIMKSGAAFVPMDGEWPDGRVNRILDQLQSPVVFVDETSRPPAGRNEEVVVVERDSFDTDKAPVHVDFEADDTIYCIYTSGSTGEPKGALNMHKGVANRFQWMNGYFEPTAEDIIMQTTHHVFDSMVWQFFWPLTFGGSAVIPAQRGVFDLEALIADITHNGVTITDFVPSELEILVYYLQHHPAVKTQLEGLRALIIGGEAMNLAAVKTYLGWFPDVSITNLYGPTECAIAMIYHPVFANQNDPVPIGRSFPNTVGVVLNERGQVQPVGVPGELHLGGICVGRGYLNQPDKTEAAFIPSPIPELVPGTLYRTGDLARLNHDGNVEYLGRIDHQFKLRGFRIEAGEIEQAITAHESVQAAAVVLRPLDGENRIVAFVMLEGEGTAATWADDLKVFLRDTLTDYMIPSHFEALEAFPLTANGKLDRKQLHELSLSREEKPVVETPELVATPLHDVEARLQTIWRELLERDSIGFDDNFFDVGGHSLLLVKLQARLEETFNRKVSAVQLFEAATIHTQAQLLRGDDEKTTVKQAPVAPSEASAAHRDIAIIGMSLNVPGAKDLDTFWDNLLAGRDTISRFDDDALRQSGVEEADLKDPNLVKAGGIIDGYEDFDAAFFGFSPRDAQLTDPQQRVMLELAWHALEHAGYRPDAVDASVGVYAGAGMNTYMLGHLLPNRPLIDEVGLLSASIGNEKDFLATRVAYKLNLQGPAVSVQTACSTSSSAIHQAVSALREKSCDMALAGGVSIDTFQDRGYLFQEEGIQSPDGVCRPFDHNSKGTVGASGAGLLVLKPLDKAEADGDTIWGVIKGSAMSNDGHAKAGFTAPSIGGQARALADALSDARLAPEDISFIESHGTGTQLGDPIEVEALHRVYGGVTDQKIALSAVKSNLGHLNSAAGVAGVIKSVLALKHGVLPATLHFEAPNPALRLEDGPFEVNAKALPLPPREDGKPHRAGISSFGIGGTNVHIVLEAPAAKPETIAEPAIPRLLPFSAQSDEGTYALAADLIYELGREGGPSLAATAYTLATGRKHFSHRRFVVAADAASAARSLILEPAEIHHLDEDRKASPLVFLFPGQGSQYVGMAGQLYHGLPEIRQHFDACFNYLNDQHGLDLASLLLNEVSSDAREKALEDTALAQPAIFVASYVVARFLMDLGLKPAAMMGHSIGEYVAATLSGVFDLEDALTLVVRRGELTAAMPEGKMLTAACSPEVAAGYRGEGVDLAAVNGPARVVFSGTLEAMEALAKKLDAEDIPNSLLHTSHAFHSHMMEAAMPELRAILEGMTRKVPNIPFIANGTGTWITTEEATSAGYWVNHLRAPVLWYQGVQTLEAGEAYNYVDCGPGRTAYELTRQCLRAASSERVVAVHALAPHPKQRHQKLELFQTALGALWTLGYDLNFEPLFTAEERKRVPLGLYPFDKQRYWIDAPDRDGVQAMPRSQGKQAMDRWFYLPQWTAQPIVAGESEGHEMVLVSDDTALRDALEGKARGAGVGFTAVDAGADITGVLDGLEPDGSYHLLYAVGLGGARSLDTAASDLSELQAQLQSSQAFSGLTRLAAALATRAGGPVKRLTVFTAGSQFLPGDVVHNPAAAPLVGLSRVIPMEMPDLPTRLVDLQPGFEQSAPIWSEVTRTPEADNSAWRGGLRYQEGFTALPLAAPGEGADTGIKQGGTYVITGGLGWIGLALAAHLHKNYRANLVLVGRTPLAEQGDAGVIKAKQLSDLEADGAKWLGLRADIGDRLACIKALDEAKAHFGEIDGIFHLAGAVAGAGSQSLAELTDDSYQRQFQAKVYGTLHLATWMEANPQTQFCLLFSSLSAVLGGLGFGAYAAANRFLDSFTSWQNSRAQQQGQAPRYRAVNWDGWQTEGEEDGPAMTMDEGMVALERFMALPGLPQIVVSTQDLHQRQQRWRGVDPASALSDETAPAVRERRIAAEDFVAPETELEKRIAAIWQTLFGFDRISRNDNFFDLGGDSLVATRYFSHLRSQVGAQLPLASLFDAPTLAGQAALASLKQAENTATQDTDDLIEELI